MEEEEEPQLGLNPDWMSRLPEELRDLPLWNLAVPGKHEHRGGFTGNGFERSSDETRIKFRVII